MNKLIGANIARLIKDKIFWVCMIIMFGFMLLTCYMNGKTTGTDSSIDGGFFLNMQFIGLLMASFSCMFVGTEYNDKTIRNKIVIGHTRSAIYLSNVIIVSLAGIFMMLMYLIPFTAIGLTVFGVENTDPFNFLYWLFASIMVIVAYSSIFTMFSMCIQNRTIVMNITIIGFFIFMGIAIYLYSQLGEDAVNATMSVFKRNLYMFLIDFLPPGQTFKISSMRGGINWLLPMYALIITVVTSVLGMVVFYKKDIK